MMNIREYCFSFRHLIQADLVHFESRRNLVIRKEYLDTVIPEVCDRESILLRSGSSIKPPRG